MARKCKEDAEKTRQAVLESALDVFSEKGYAKATFDEIAARAGFTKGAVYWYFRNKADLVAALIVEYVGRKREEILPKLPADNTLEDLLKYFMLWAEFERNDVRYAKFHRFILCQMEWSEATLNRVEKGLTDIKNWHLEKIKQTLVESEERGELKDGLDLDNIVSVVMSTYTGITFSSLSKRFDTDIVKMVETGLGLLFEGLKK